MKLKKGFCADSTECICISLTHFSLQPVTAKPVLLQDSSGHICGVHCEYQTRLFLVLPLIFDIVSSIFHTHSHAAVINIDSWKGL